MLKNEVAEKYAQALFEVAVGENALEETLQQLTEVIEVIAESKELKKVLEHPKLTVKQKKEIYTEVFSEEVSERVLNFLKLLFDKNREDYLIDIQQQFKKLANQYQGKLEVVVKAPIELSAEHKKNLKDKLEKLTEKEIQLNVSIKSELLGGLVLEIGDKVIDGSLLNQLKRLKTNLNNLEVSKLGVK
ncbi:F0F1 ATP synthase subunit delta [Natroniella sp. ANB-PHB2]|uniref:F0F1 ATP synthase subunit delta n=1 Tax=Natroniella sp. ANB-PHB2 TaxID=3384444 RepID=UPI0038D4C6BF